MLPHTLNLRSVQRPRAVTPTLSVFGRLQEDRPGRNTTSRSQCENDAATGLLDHALDDVAMLQALSVADHGIMSWRLQAHGNADAETVTNSGARFSDTFWWCRKASKWCTAPSNAREQPIEIKTEGDAELPKRICSHWRVAAAGQARARRNRMSPFAPIAKKFAVALQVLSRCRHRFRCKTDTVKWLLPPTSGP